MGISGDIKNGKTWCLVNLLYSDLLKGQLLVTNFDIGLPHRRISVSDFKEDDNIRDVTLGMDELQQDLDCREANSRYVRNFTRALTKVGKKRVRLYYTSHLFSMVDKRVRDHTNIRYVVQKVDLLSPTSDFVVRCISQYSGEYFDRLIPYSYARRFFGLYDFNELIMSRHVSPAPLVSGEARFKGLGDRCVVVGSCLVGWSMVVVVFLLVG